MASGAGEDNIALYGHPAQRYQSISELQEQLQCLRTDTQSKPCREREAPLVVTSAGTASLTHQNPATDAEVDLVLKDKLSLLEEMMRKDMEEGRGLVRIFAILFGASGVTFFAGIPDWPGMPLLTGLISGAGLALPMSMSFHTRRKRVTFAKKVISVLRDKDSRKRMRLAKITAAHGSYNLAIINGEDSFVTMTKMIPLNPLSNIWSSLATASQLESIVEKKTFPIDCDVFLDSTGFPVGILLGGEVGVNYP